MEKQKKLYFFNDKLKDLPKWVSTSLSIGLGILLAEMIFKVTEYSWPAYIVVAIYLMIIGYSIFKSTRKNAFTWVKETEFKIEIKGKKLDVDATFLSDFYVEENQLHIIRINRLDKFPIDHFSEKDIKKMLHLMKLQQANANN
ncbi:hypothetical protein LX97_03400 [Nonlabens dokdonensis]|uniref:Uncharacterized protein n=2 Tax=Nonlabens dokdonensis TaxID=328515 RepID=L7W8B2_NONDD|nr:hypothetical protein [Nonlabens dokdonensis]AGC77925.1 hypothetical protein DDD_2798 [Nonlabens dokdonensis DSW-6]PZX36643.1 hypothetical protein LX97_03400 [Nonlabens dokdonensis]